MNNAKEMILNHMEKQSKIACSEVWQKNNVKKNKGTLTAFDQKKLEILESLSERASKFITSKSDEFIEANNEKFMRTFDSHQMINKAHAEAYKLINK